ncbi:MAG: addiction module protein [Casimicrobiaceae bacterium]
MTATVLSPEQIAQLTPEQRLTLIEALWDSLQQDDLPIMPAQAAELDRRMATYEEDAANAQPWDSVRKRIERNLS